MAQSIAALQRALTDFQQKAQMEMDPDRRNELKIKHTEYTRKTEQYRNQIEQSKRSQLFQSTAPPLQPTIEQQQQQEYERYINPGSTSAANANLRERETASLHRSIQMVDSYLDMGYESLKNLKRQHSALEAAQKRMIDAANTLGLSQETIRWIERRTAQDMYIFWGGVSVITLLFVLYFVYR